MCKKKKTKKKINFSVEKKWREGAVYLKLSGVVFVNPMASVIEQIAWIF